MSTASDVTNLKRWLADAKTARDGAQAAVDNLDAQAAAAEAALEELETKVTEAEAALAEAEDELENGEAPSGAVTYAEADVAEGKGTA
jgi:chromosome segregation ATPase